ncbi:EAL domain-containing protein [Glaciecola petra]|uniref:EAL domain-containing protein n=1 Tax=Glaciecola petra TaxID=3075602 RepID=A0ABU2ZUT6_9ALTE|nr:EAL domain-containing protein [Aestuariibacter sp. P117]MDT0596403.1 EAL domain-containing protein [Aestuariibacter sp. P117]
MTLKINTHPYMSPLRSAIALVCLLSVAFTLHNKAFSKQSSFESIAHFRAIPIYLSNNKNLSFTRHSKQDNDGFLWISGGQGLLRYDGYKLEAFDVGNNNTIQEYTVSYPFIDSEGDLWAGNKLLYRFNNESQQFVPVGTPINQTIYKIIEDNNRKLWISGEGFGLITHDKVTGLTQRIQLPLPENEKPFYIHSMVFNAKTNEIWFISEKGIFNYAPETNQIYKVKSPIDNILGTFIVRDITVNEELNQLWIGTPSGLLLIDTKTESMQLINRESTAWNLPADHVTTTFLDSSNRLWVGIEKRGLCLLTTSGESFTCLAPSFDQKNKIPIATIEDISEDDSGSLWLSMNSYGLVRITPQLEVFRRLIDSVKAPVGDYFPHSYNAVVRDNGDIWVATDGGGINIFNMDTGNFRNLKQEPYDDNSLPSNSIIALGEDANGMIWASTWAGGIVRIDPDTMSFQRYSRTSSIEDSKVLAGNNVFSMDFDTNGHLWLSIWGLGLQKFNQNTGEFTTYLATPNTDKIGLQSSDISHLTIYENKLFITGEGGLELFDLESGEFEFIFNDASPGFRYVFVESLEKIYVGTRNGLVKLNYMTGETEVFTTDDGLPSNEINYIHIDRNGDLWVACTNGVALYNPLEGKFRAFTNHDGIAGDKMSTHGEFFEHDGDLFIPGKYGVSIVNPDSIPKDNHIPKTQITDVRYSSADKVEQQKLNISRNQQHQHIIDYEFNTIRFEFSALSYIFPEKNHFRYRLIGWQDEFVAATASERNAIYTNLPAGEYRFEVISAGINGNWDLTGDNFSFKIPQPWWQTTWLKLTIALSIMLLLYLIYRGRVALVLEREKLLEQKVAEKTKQLALFNSELEMRVKDRTEELEQEINERKTIESKLFHMAFHDSLTGLHNRQWTIDRIEKLLSSVSKGTIKGFGILFIDGDRFKQINDTHGHTLGDDILIAAANRLTDLLGEGQSVTRLGGDEFTVIVEKDYDVASLEKLGKSLVLAFKAPFQMNENTFHFNVSIGILPCDSSYSEVPSVLRDADIAMYRAKDLGKATYKVFDQEMRETKLELAALEASLYEAAVANDFHLVYQPIVDVKSKRIYSFEALIRWQHPTRGNIPPDIFIPIAEEAGLIWKIGAWVLNEACRQTSVWHKDLQADIKPKISVNISSKQLSHERFLKLVDDTLTTNNLAPEYLTLELTESVLIENTDLIGALLLSFNERNIDLAIDDFGTGYSSLAYLNQLPVQHIKIDKKFIDSIDKNNCDEDNKDALQVVKSTIGLGKGLNKKITAEGVENEFQLNYLEKYGCDYVQGYFLDKPLSPETAYERINKA